MPGGAHLQPRAEGCGGKKKRRPSAEGASERCGGRGRVLDLASETGWLGLVDFDWLPSALPRRRRAYFERNASIGFQALTRHFVQLLRLSDGKDSKWLQSVERLKETNYIMTGKRLCEGHCKTAN